MGSARAFPVADIAELNGLEAKKDRWAEWLGIVFVLDELREAELNLQTRGTFYVSVEMPRAASVYARIQCDRVSTECDSRIIMIPKPNLNYRTHIRIWVL